MAITVSWYDEKQQIVFYDIEGIWDWSELLQAVEEAIHLMDSVDHPFAVLIDFTRGNSVPKMNIAAMRSLATAPPTKHPNLTQFYIVGLKPNLNTVLEIFRRLFPAVFAQSSLLKTRQEALVEIERYQGR